MAGGPKQKDIVGIKREVLTAAPRPSCDIDREKLNGLKCGAPRRLLHTDLFLSDVKKDSFAARLKRQSKSLFAILLAFASFSVSNCHLDKDYFQVFRFEPLHKLGLRMSKLQKERACELLRDSDRESTSMRNKSNEPQKYNRVQRSILHVLNLFLETFEKECDGYWPRVRHRKDVSGGALKRLFNETGVAGMLDAKEFDTFDMLLPFVSAIIDECCGKEAEALVTLVFTLYVHLDSLIHKRNLRSGWTEADCSELDRNKNIQELSSI